ncbi:histone acetyltransferase [Burkholderia cenocepacia]|nr:histone acetyltransferase [Burkholderia sp. AU17457]RQU14702.1 histone acetyltransferase [Burkholderia cenocepacia]RQU28271.1 histone acetyltransferase [Burkholderia cenocepacia]
MRPGRAPFAMRIDVQHSQHDIDDELDTLYDRLHQPGHRLHGLSAVALGRSGLIVRHREADGEYFLYVEDPVARQLAGYTVFNRLPEIPRRADRYLRAPHTRLRGSAQRKGLATTLYRWGLDAGLCLISGARQSVGAAQLWTALAQDYAHGFVDVEGRALHYLGEAVADDVHGALHTRRLLLGNGWTLGELAQATGMTGVDAAEDANGNVRRGEHERHPVRSVGHARPVAHMAHAPMR